MLSNSFGVYEGDGIAIPSFVGGTMSPDYSIIFAGLLIRARFENALDALLNQTAMPKNFVDGHLTVEQRISWHRAVAVRKKAEREQRELCDAPEASIEYYRRCSVVARALTHLHRRFRNVRYAIGLDPSKRRVELKRLRLEHRQHEEAFRAVFREKRLLSQDEKAALSVRESGRYRWVPHIETRDPAASWPVEVRYADEIALVRKWIAEIDDAIEGYKAAVSS